MKKYCVVLLTVLIMGIFVGCGDSEKQYKEAIDKAIAYNHEICEEHYKDSDDITKEKYWFDRGKSDFTVWEDDNNYYVLVQKNYDYESYDGVEKWTSADGYKIGKSNDRVSTTPEDRTQIVNFYQNNMEPVYTEKNVGVECESITRDMK